MNFPTISSPRVDVLWAGWRSDTFTLQEQGWQLSAEQDMSSMRFRIALKHPNFRMYGLSQLMRYEEYMEFFSHHQAFSKAQPMIIQYMASRLEINLMDDLSMFQPIDALPQMNVERKVKSIEDFLIFRPINNAKEIIVPDYQVSELLSMIISKQDPKQSEIREKKRKEWRKFQREINTAEQINVEQVVDNRNDIVAQLVCVR